MKWLASALSDVGRKRKHNEDSYVENARLGLFLVADGMGGHNAGEVASRMAADMLSAEVIKHQKLIESYQHGPNASLRRQILGVMENGVLKACAAIYDAAERDEKTRGMGTTLSALLLVGRSGFWVHVGDSRIYLLRDGVVHRLTDDHSLLAEQVRKGLMSREEASEMKEFRNVITRGVGVLRSIEVDSQHIELATADRFLLCSDGLHEYLKDPEIPAMFDAQNLEEITRRLIALANERGGKDNITAVVVEVPDLPQDPNQVEVNRKLEALRQIPLFAKLTYSELVKTLNIAQIVRAAQDDLIIREGEAGDCLYIIIQGGVDILRDGVFLTSLDRGGHFGEMALISNAPRSATVRASKECSLLMIGRTDFYQLLNTEPHLSVKILLAFIEVLSERLNETSQAFSEWRKRLTQLEISH